MNDSATSSTKLYTSTVSQRWSMASWRVRGSALLRIFHGFVWATDAWMKWQSGFINNLLKYPENAMSHFLPSFTVTWKVKEYVCTSLNG